jgi:hypothetical protein
MAEKITLNKTYLNNKNFKDTVDTSFKFFAEPVPVIDPDTIEELFRLYNKLFYQIPVNGPNSHQYIVTKSSELYTAPQVSEEIQPLLDEVADLRARLLQANEQILQLSQQVNNG